MTTSSTWRYVIGLATVTVLLTGALPVRADGITSEQAQQILDELRAIRKNLGPRPIAPAAAAPAPARPVDDKVSYAFPAGGFSIGRDDAPLVMVEYTDYQCPFCQRFHNTAFVQIKTNYVDTGKLRYVSRDFPLPFHENARRSAVAGRCAAEQGKYWELRHTISSTRTSSSLTRSSVTHRARRSTSTSSRRASTRTSTRPPSTGTSPKVRPRA